MKLCNKWNQGKKGKYRCIEMAVIAKENKEKCNDVHNKKYHVITPVFPVIIK